MARVYLSLGSNIDRERNLKAAYKALNAAYAPLTVSQVYESEAVGFEGSHFYNLVIGLDTEKSVGELSKHLHAIEDANGRVRGGPKFAARTLDIDILTYGDLSGEHDGIVLPREETLKNAFVLQPLAEIAGSEKHPVSGKKYAEHWAEYDKSKQKLWAIPFSW